jgi:hypothetical protein
MDVAKAAEHTLRLFAKEHPHTTVKASKSPEGIGVCHAFWMLQQICGGEVSDTKAHRWLGYAQALLVQDKYLSLDQCKIANALA